MARRESLKHMLAQVTQILASQAAYGHSKKLEKSENGGQIPSDRIYSYKTMDNYLAASKQFIRWAREECHCRSIDDARQYVPDYLRQRAADMSAWTVARDACALSHLYNCRTTDWGVEMPTRHRGNVTQHRSSSTYEGHFSETRNADLVDLARSTGLRRHEIAALTPDDVKVKADGTVVVHVRQGKGGKARDVIALTDAPARLAAQAAEEGREYIIDHIPKYAPIHAYRREYAQTLYAQLARPIESLSRKEKYECKGELQGTVYDRAAMHEVSSNLGHERIAVVTHYLF